MENKQVTGVVFLDIKEAFDMVDDTTLLKKLKRYVISTGSVGWSSNYLYGRLHAVYYKENKANCTLSTRGEDAVS